MSEETVSTEAAPVDEGEGFKPIESQADLDRIIQARLDRERKKHPSEDELSELRGKAERVESLESESASQVAEAAGRAEKAEAEAQRLGVILEYGIPEKLRPLVDGDSVESMTEKAKALSEELASSKGNESTASTSEAPRMPLEGRAPDNFALNSDEVENSLKRALGIPN